MARVVLWCGSTQRGRGQWGVLSSPSPTEVPSRSCTPWVRVARLVLTSLVQTIWLLVVTKSVLADGFQYASWIYVIRTLSNKLPDHPVGNNMLLAALPLSRCCPGPRSHYMEQLKSSFRLKRGLEMVSSSWWSCCCFALSDVRALHLLPLLSSTWPHLDSPWSVCLL